MAWLGCKKLLNKLLLSAAIAKRLPGIGTEVTTGVNFKRSSVQIKQYTNFPKVYISHFCYKNHPLTSAPHASLTLRYCSSKHNNVGDPNVDEKKLTVMQRFTQVYKEYGKTLILVHVTSSIVWYGGFYVLAKSGIDLLPLLVKLGLSEALQQKYLLAGDFVVAYIIYELTKPVRYLFTLAATRQTVRYMRKIGYLPELKPEDKLRNLAKDGRDNLKDKYQEQKYDMKEKLQEQRNKYKKKWHHIRKQTKLKRGLGSPLQKSQGPHRPLRPRNGSKFRGH